MSGDKYIPHPMTPEEHANNVRFQLDNIDGFLKLDGQFGGSAAALAKAECLFESAALLKASLQSRIALRKAEATA